MSNVDQTIQNTIEAGGQDCGNCENWRNLVTERRDDGSHWHNSVAAGSPCIIEQCANCGDEAFDIYDLEDLPPEAFQADYGEIDEPPFPEDCPKCGAQTSERRCDECEDGASYHDCGEDTCCCENPMANVRCDECNGKGWLKRSSAR